MLPHHRPLLLLASIAFLFSCEAAQPTEERATDDALFTTTATRATTDSPDDCAILGKKGKFPRFLLQVGACGLATTIIAQGDQAIRTCCPNWLYASECESATTWVERAQEYKDARCNRRMSCGEIAGLYLWMNSKQRLFTNLTRRCTPDESDDTPADEEALEELILVQDILQQ